ncbi:autotransporter assembly complex family protein [Paralimibaculum aggregatum]|uniref:Autotransporter assembly complex family protein n=1 Tax=Paralimibaculum aggregatum TaxID=3036245 RepID=A0ABQ6LM38_9RHOB|nr:autotransporter assembly complex family protein [Limibaculum sp. NKW23]GMG81355.1 autotransporter assembly complex family protein [Limibaculum sp. NKW23]
MNHASPRFGRLARALVAACGLLLTACSNGEDEPFALFSEPETALDYEVVVTGAPSEEIADLMERSLALYRQQEKGANSAAFLRRRAEGDIETAQKILRSRGYYQAEIETRIEVDETPPPPPGDADPDAEPPKMRATAHFEIAPGPQLTLAEHRMQLIDTGGTPPEPLSAAALGSPVGGPALAAGIVGAEGAAVTRLRNAGRPYAQFRDRDAVADLEAGTLEVESFIATGPVYRYGEIVIEGAPDIDNDYLLSYRPWKADGLYSSAELKEYQKRLFSTGLFSGASLHPPETPPEGATAPVIMELDEAPPRTVALGARISTDDGPAFRGSFEHRNVFGAGERIGLATEISFDEQIAAATFLKPQFLLRHGQDLVGGLELRHVDEDAYQEVGATLSIGINRRLTERWKIGLGGLIEASRVDEGFGDEEVLLFGVPGFVEYDSTDDLLDATKGYRLRVQATPFTGLFAGESTNFFRVSARASAYQDILGDERFVLAERGRIGSIVTEGLSKVPATRRFYSGGGGSVRGYQEDFIGPLDSTNDPIGGLSVIEFGAELRARVYGDFGVVVFADAGAISEDTLPDFSDRLQVAAGFGVRYYSPIGPVRIDIAFPINGRDVDDSFQAYLSVGQAF